jgi:exopolysaccharide production protein ExoZ
VAALLVLVHHLSEEARHFLPAGALTDKLVLFGACGVDVFFVLSGFVIHFATSRAVAGNKAAGTPWGFLIRRIARVVPLYWVMTFIVLAMWATGKFYKSQSWGISGVFSSLLFIPTEDMVIRAGWTLNYEMYFYALYTVSLLFLPRRAALTVGCAVIVMLLGVNGTSPWPYAINALGNPIVMEFIFGMLLAEAHMRKLFNPTGWLVRVGLVSGGLLMSLSTFVFPGNGTSGLSVDCRWFAWGVPAAMLVTYAIYRECENKALLFLGDASYALYLTHGIVMTAVAAILKSNLLQAVPISLIMLVAAMAHLYIEKPLGRLTGRWIVSNHRAFPSMD